MQHRRNRIRNPQSASAEAGNESAAHSADSNVPPIFDRFMAKIEWRDPKQLSSARRNARTHSQSQIAQIAASIQQFGFVNPILIGDDGCIVAGHGRAAAAKKLGLDEVPVIRLDHLSANERRAYALADNRLAEIAGWDRELLAVELQELSEIDLNFDIEITGFETAEIDILVDEHRRGDDSSDDLLIQESVEAPTTRTGDSWVLGEHRIICGDALDPAVFTIIMHNEQADMAFTDPPYNVRIDKHVCGLGTIHHREFKMACGEMSEDEFVRFLQHTLKNHAEHCRNGAVIFCCMDWRHLFELQTAARRVDLPTLNLCVWSKTNGGMGAFYRSAHELILVLKKGNAPHRNNIQLGRYGRYRTNVWHIEGANTIRAARREELALHPTVKPVTLVAEAIKDVTKRGDLVLDGFAGSGTTILAAQKTGRRCCAIELDPGYVDVAIRRWQALSGEEAVHAESGIAFEELAESRAAEPAPRTRKRRKPTSPEV
jgi:DNA modification methylase